MIGNIIIIVGHAIVDIIAEIIISKNWGENNGKVYTDINKSSNKYSH